MKTSSPTFIFAILTYPILKTMGESNSINQDVAESYINKLLNMTAHIPHTNLRGSHRHWNHSTGYCPLAGLGKFFDNDKMVSHQYLPIYCEKLQPFRKSDTRLRMLEIGFGCGHHGERGSSANMWKSFFHMRHGPGVDLWEIDWPSSLQKCIDEYYKDWPKGSIVNEIFLGDQSNVTFLTEVVSVTGGRFDIIIDDGGHKYGLIKTSFEFLWQHVAPGGYYFIEDMAVFSDKSATTSIPNYLMGFVDQLALGRKNKHTKKSEFRWQANCPSDVSSVHCEDEICALRKKFPDSQYLSDNFKNLVSM